MSLQIEKQLFVMVLGFCCAVGFVNAENDLNHSDISYVFTTSFHTIHFHPSEDHNNRQNLFGLERRDGSTLWGGAVFKNSFNQSSQYAYWGKQYYWDESDRGLRGALTFGLLRGYRGKYKKKLAMNHYGVAPAILPSIGYTARYLEGDAVLLGLNGLLFSLSLPLTFL